MSFKMDFNDPKRRREYIARNKQIAEHEAELNYREKIKVWLSLTKGELSNTPLFKMISDQYPDLPDGVELEEVIIIKLFEKILKQDSQRALEHLHKLTGAMDDQSIRVSFTNLYEATKGIE